MRGNHSEQQKRGKWAKPPSDRGLFKRGKLYYVRFADAAGKVRAESTGSPSRAFALKILEKRRTEVRESRYFPKVREVSVDEIIKDAIERACQHHELSYPGKKFRPYRYRIVGEWFKGRAAASLTPGEIAAKIAEHTKTPANFNRYRVALSHAYKLAVEERKLSVNPAASVSMKRENKDYVRYLGQHAPLKSNLAYLKPLRDEEARLRAVIRKRFAKREPELTLALNTGLRFEEQYSLRWQDISGNQLSVFGKGNRLRHVPLNAAALDALTRLKKLAPKSDLVCPGKKEHREWWDAARREAAIAYLRWHDLRHTFASRLVMNGVDVYRVKQLLGHGSVVTTERYAHLSARHLAAAVEKLAGVTKSDTATSVPASPEGATIQ